MPGGPTATTKDRQWEGHYKQILIQISKIESSRELCVTELHYTKC
jgi:hypothetical protein